MGSTFILKWTTRCSISSMGPWDVMIDNTSFCVNCSNWCQGLIFFFFPSYVGSSRNTKSTSSLRRRGPTAVFVTTAPWRSWRSTATWWASSGCPTPFSGTPRMPTPTGSPCPISCSEYGTTARYFIPWGKQISTWHSEMSPTSCGSVPRDTK